MIPLSNTIETTIQSPPKPPENPHLKPPENPHLKPAENPHLKPPENPHLKPPENPHLKPPENPHLKPAENPHLKPPENPHLKPLENPHLKPPENPHLKPPENLHLKPPGNPHLKPAEKANIVTELYQPRPLATEVMLQFADVEWAHPLIWKAWWFAATHPCATHYIDVMGTINYYPFQLRVTNPASRTNPRILHVQPSKLDYRKYRRNLIIEATINEVKEPPQQ